MSPAELRSVLSYPQRQVRQPNGKLFQLFGGVGAALIGIAAFRWYRKWRAEAGNRETMEVLRQIQRDRNAEPAAAASAARRTGGGVAEAGEEDTSTCRVCLQGSESDRS